MPDNFCPNTDRNVPKTDKIRLLFCPFLDRVLSEDGQFHGFKMTEDGAKKAVKIGQKQGLPIYRANPSVPDADSITKRKPVRFGDDKRGFVVDGGSGEVLAVGGMGFYEFEEVDNARFVKLFLAGLKQAAGLSKAGLAVFELVYRQVQENPNTDKVELSFLIASEQFKGLNDRTYRRGLRELLEKEFLFRSLADGVFFVNIQYMFNGDRLAFVKGYQRKSAQSQADLFDAVPDALPPPKDEK